MPGRHQATQAHPPSRQGHSKMVLWSPNAVCTAFLSICYLTASTHYSSGALIPECNGLSQFIRGHRWTLCACPRNKSHSIPAITPTNSKPMPWPGFEPRPLWVIRPSRHCDSESAQAHWVTETGYVHPRLNANNYSINSNWVSPPKLSTNHRKGNPNYLLLQNAWRKLTYGAMFSNMAISGPVPNMFW